MQNNSIYIYGDIYNDQSDFTSEWGAVSLTEVVKQLNALDSDVDEVVVHIHSRGGEVDEGFAIHDYLVNWGIINEVKITTQVDGLCASIATIVALSGSVRKMAEHSEFFIHNAWGFGAGDADYMEKYAEELRKAENKILDLYETKTGADRDKLSEAMKRETSLSSTEAKDLGFVTEVIQTSMKAVAFLGNKTQKPLNNMEVKEIKDEMGFLRSALNSISEKLGVGKKPEIKNLDLTLTDGTDIVVETESDSPAVGDAVTVDGSPAPDGEHTIADGRTLVTEGGVITEIRDPESEEEETIENVKKERDELKAKLDELQNTFTDEVKAMKDELLDLKKNIKSEEVPPEAPREQMNRVGQDSDGLGLKERVEQRRQERKAKMKSE